MTNIELKPSVPEEVPATPSPETPPAGDKKPDEVTPDAALYELPDGRKVTADVLQKEWKENFLPEFTRKSQKLADIEKVTTPQDPNQPEWKRDGYVPKSYGELVELGAQQALAAIEERQRAEAAQRQEVAKAVDGQLAALKTKDPKLDEGALFAHAQKYGFRDLGAAYANLQDMKNIELTTEQRVLKNAGKRIDPISGGGSQPSAPGTAVDYSGLSQFGGAADFLSRIKPK